MEYEIRDMTGALILQGEGEVVNMSGLSHGIYLLFINDEVHKVVKQ